MDITAQREVEAALQRLNGDLEREVAARAAALDTANRELEAFAYSVSHDLRVPLRAVDGFSKILADDYQGSLDAEGHRLIGVIRDNTARMGRMIDDILAYSRAGRRELAMGVVDMAALARSAAGELAATYEGRRVSLAWGPLPAVRGDRALLKQVWINLLANAIKFTRPRAEARIEVGCESRNGEHVFFVRDNGVGFDMKYAGKLFGVFHRLHGPMEFEGSGVGLAVVSQVIVRHGGRVWGEGTLDQGATFYFALPVPPEGSS